MKTKTNAAMARADFLESARDELAVWKGRMEGLRLQATLGRMEMDQNLEPTLSRLEILYDKARRYLHELARDEMSWDEIEPELTKAMSDLRREIDSAGAEFRVC